ncbi:MAG: group II intron reverse transcriptase/maturase [Gelidibacter sp.]
MVWEAYLQVRRKGKSAGIDDLSMSQYDLQRHRHLYKVWNRLASGSYFPPPVLQVEIPKKNGSIRQLGIPTISDRVAQTVIKNQIEERLEKIFHPQSYGYRPKRSAHQALDQVRKNCWKFKALGKHVEEKWVLRYIERWLKAPLQTRKGEIIARTNGTPQGGVISPLLANLFLHYTLDVWLGRLSPSIEFVRYADDIIIHCSTQSQAEQSLQKIKERVEYCGLTLHPDKTKIIYCKDFRRQQKYKKMKFDFLGYTFQPRTSKSKKTGKLFLGFDCAISIQSRLRIFEQIRKMEIPRMRCDSITGIAHHLNPKLRGWIRYFGKYRGYSLSEVFYILRIKLVRWARYHYKRYRNNLTKAYRWLDRVREQYPSLFYHWYIGYSN